MFFKERRSSLLMLFIIVFAFVSGFEARANLLPDNDWHLFDDIHSKEANIDEALFNQIIDKAQAIYEPMAKAHGGSLSIDKKWEDPTVNASAARIISLWFVTMYGGLARRPEISPDGFTLVVCHELGHLFAGFPFRRTILGRFAWASNEGAADYYATHVCSKEMWRDESEINARAALTVEPAAREACDTSWQSDEDRHLCYRAAEAGKNLAVLLAALRKKNESPDFTTPDPHRVKVTSNMHPASQCRLDTYFSGALCSRRFDPENIPGKTWAGMVGSIFDFRAEKLAARASCHPSLGDSAGVRPACWFKSRKWRE